VTRRCSERRYFLRPSRLTNDLVLYLLAVSAQRHGVLIHAFCVLSNHLHMVVTDVDARLPAFMQYLDSLIARAVNASIGRFEGFWSSESYSAVEPLAAADVVAKVAYVLANPVAAALVRSGSEWPGLRTSPDEIGSAKLEVRRPEHFFDPKGPMPESVELELTAPPGFNAGEFRALVTEAVNEEEAKHRRELSAAGRRFLGVARVLAQNPFARPAPGEPRFGMKPRVAARDKWKRIEGLVRLKTFLVDYRRAWLERRRGKAGVVFPRGTYLLRVLHGVACAGDG
jgi:REP element-mobilizing transposase RayT